MAISLESSQETISPYVVFCQKAKHEGEKDRIVMTRFAKSQQHAMKLAFEMYAENVLPLWTVEPINDDEETSRKEGMVEFMKWAVDGRIAIDVRPNPDLWNRKQSPWLELFMIDVKNQSHVVVDSEKLFQKLKTM